MDRMKNIIYKIKLRTNLMLKLKMKLKINLMIYQAMIKSSYHM